jgi:hypothetical protein
LPDVIKCQINSELISDKTKILRMDLEWKDRNIKMYLIIQQ